MLGVLAIAGVCEGGELVDDRTEEIGFKDRILPLQDHRQPFEAHASINIGLLEQCALAVGVLVILHEDQVPDLQIALATVAAWRTVWLTTAELDAAIIVNLGVWSAWPRGPRWPPPVVAQPGDAVGGDARDLLPIAG